MSSQIRLHTTPNFIGWDVERAEHWTDDAVCKDVGTDQFYPDTVAEMNQTRQVCLRCPVRRECLEQALKDDEMGIWGGSTEGERRAIRKGSITVDVFLAPRAPRPEKKVRLESIFEVCGHRRTINNVAQNGTVSGRCRTCNTDRLREARKERGILPVAVSRANLIASIEVDAAAGMSGDQIAEKNGMKRNNLRLRMTRAGRQDLAELFFAKRATCGHSPDALIKDGTQNGKQKYTCGACLARRRAGKTRQVA